MDNVLNEIVIVEVGGRRGRQRKMEERHQEMQHLLALKMKEGIL